NREPGVAHRARRAGEMVDALDGRERRQLAAHVMLDEPEPRLVHEAGEVLEAAGRKVVEAPHFMTTGGQRLAHVRADHAGATGDYGLQGRAPWRCAFWTLRAALMRGHWGTALGREAGRSSNVRSPGGDGPGACGGEYHTGLYRICSMDICNVFHMV